MNRQFWSWVGVAALSLTTAGLCQAAEEYKLDHYEVKSAAASPGASIFIEDFSIENTDFGKQKKEKQKETVAMMKRAAPSAFTECLISRLGESGAFGEVSELRERQVPAGGFLIQGSFTVLNPGNRAARYWASGMAGKAKICLEGRVLGADGTQVIIFEDCRKGSGLWTFGGNSAGLMMADLDHSAEALATVLAAWAKGELPVSVANEK